MCDISVRRVTFTQAEITGISWNVGEGNGR